MRVTHWLHVPRLIKKALCCEGAHLIIAKNLSFEVNTTTHHEVGISSGVLSFNIREIDLPATICLTQQSVDSHGLLVRNVVCEEFKVSNSELNHKSRVTIR